MYYPSHLNPGEHRLIVDAHYRFYRKSLPSKTQVVATYITLQTICSLTVSITGLPRAHSDGVAYQDVKERRYIIAKNAMSVFMLNVLNYITVSDIIFLSLSIHNSSNRTQQFKRSNENISYKNNRKVRY